jgi:hypothetical protein
MPVSVGAASAAKIAAEAAPAWNYEPSGNRGISTIQNSIIRFIGYKVLSSG